MTFYACDRQKFRFNWIFDIYWQPWQESSPRCLFYSTPVICNLVGLMHWKVNALGICRVQMAEVRVKSGLCGIGESTKLPWFQDFHAFL